MRRPRRRGRGQAMSEFALVIPVLLLFCFGILDLGRVIYAYVTIVQAANEGGRVAVRSSSPPPDNSAVEHAITSHAIAVLLANPCANGPVTSAVPPANSGYLFITEYPAPTSLELSPAYNAPGGQATGISSGGCSAIAPASGNVPLQVTIKYNFVPITPLLAQVAPSIVLTASAVYRTEY